ncbi:MAG: inositol-3-phosphate synthase, partial [Nitrososphaeraceae archaeon]
MSRKVRVAIAGVGNCASALIQGIHYYTKHSSDAVGLTAYSLGGIVPGDIEFVAAFDVTEGKVGKDLSEAIYAEPNNTPSIIDGLDKLDVRVEKGSVLDGLGKHYLEKIKVSDAPETDVASILKDSGAEILLNYLPVGSRAATQFYAEQCLETRKVSFINAIPVFIASAAKWQQSFEGRGLVCAGDDVMSQLGATVVHKSLIKLFVDRGVKIDDTYQLN